MTKIRLKKYRKQLVGFVAGVVVTAAAIGGWSMLKRQEVALPYTSDAAAVRWLPPTVTHFRSQVQRQAKRYNINPTLVAIIMTLESGGFTKADSGQATGLMQLTPYTAADIAKKYLRHPAANYDLKNSSTNIEFGVAYLAYLRDTFCDYKDEPNWNDCVELIAAGYNGGPGAANQLFLGHGLEQVETASYSRNALNMWREQGAKTSPTYDRWLDAGGQSLVDKAKAEKR